MIVQANNELTGIHVQMYKENDHFRTSLLKSTLQSLVVHIFDNEKLYKFRELPKNKTSIVLNMSMIVLTEDSIKELGEIVKELDTINIELANRLQNIILNK